MKRYLVHCLFVTAGLLAFGDRQVHAQAAPNVVGVYVGFFRSITDPTQLGMVELDITRQVGMNFFGQLTMDSNGLRLPFIFMGMVDATGVFRGAGQGEAGRVAFLGWFRDLGGGAAYVLSGYEFVPTGGAPTHGIANLLRSFVEDPSLMPPNINGNWIGTFTSAHSVQPGPCRLEVQQTSDSSGAPGPGFSGQLFLGTQAFEIMGTINGRDQCFVIGQGAAGFVFIQGVLVQPGPCRLSYVLVFTDGSIDFGALDVTQTSR